MSTYCELLSEYNKLKEDFDEHKKVAIEYEGELEETNKDYDNRNGELMQANEKLLKEINKIKEDYLQFKDRNMEKTREIEFLENQMDKLKAVIEQFKGERSICDKKIILLENENNDYHHKARELECWTEELKSKLDAALEENIILHNENEATKGEMEESIQRLQEELEESKNEVTSKEKIINRMTMNRDFLLKTAYNAQDDLNNNIISSKSYKNLRVITPVNKNMKIPEKFMQSYSKSFLNNNNNNSSEVKDKYEIQNEENKLNNDKDDSIIENTDNYDNNYDDKEDLMANIDVQSFRLKDSFIESGLGLKKQLSNAELQSNYTKTKKISVNGLEKFLCKDLKASIVTTTDINEDDEEREFIRQRIDMEVKNILDTRRNFLLNTLTHENFSFDVVGSIRNKQIVHDTDSKVLYKNQKLVENIDDMLAKIQARKDKVMMQKKTMQNKLERVGIKIC